MKKVDYIIVGCGLAGIAFCEQLMSHNKSFIVFDDHSQLSSIVAAGLYNPVVLKRFTNVWKSKEQMAIALPFYKGLEEKLNIKLDYELPVYRRFTSVEEQNDWFIAADKPILEEYLSPNLIKKHNPSIEAAFGFGKVSHSGRIDTALLLKSYKEFLKSQRSYRFERFDYSNLILKEDEYIYNNLKSKYIVFAEGFGMVKNPYFNHLPLNVAKGEVLTIYAPQLKIDFILKSSIFIVPEGNDRYSVGATYNWKDKTHDTTVEARDELLSNLKQVINCEFEVIGQRAGIRPTVKDRRPLVGLHSKHRTMAILNGLGTRGVMIAPYAAKQLFEHIENGVSIDSEMNIDRFD